MANQREPLASTDVATKNYVDTAVAAGGGGSQPVAKASVAVSSAEILDLVASPKLLVAGQAGKVIIVTSTTVAYAAGLTPYTDNSGGCEVGFSGNLNNGAAFATNWVNFIDQATAQILWQGYGATGGAPPTVGYDGVDLVFAGTTADATDGDGTLIVTVVYYLADLP